jgi:hypothetical protein
MTVRFGQRAATSPRSEAQAADALMAWRSFPTVRMQFASPNSACRAPLAAKSAAITQVVAQIEPVSANRTQKVSVTFVAAEAPRCCR